MRNILCNILKSIMIESGENRMKRFGLYIGIAVTGLLWVTPVLSYADTTIETVSAVIEAPEEEDLAEMTGPAIEVQMALAEAAAQAQAQAEAEAAQTANAERRQNLVNYALQFVGGRYVAGGNDPHTGADCSGFTRYVMQHGAGVSLNRSSGSQATQGRTISANEMQPGDLIFYGNGSRVNHVAMYIGNGQIVHASTYSTGIKISQWNYRAPVRIASVLD